MEPVSSSSFFNFYHEEIYEMKSVKYLALLSILAVLSPLGAFARDKNQRSVDLPDAVQVGGKQLEPGHYKLQWQGSGPDVQVTFQQNGKTVATAQAEVKTNDSHVTQDAVVESENKTLNEIDFSRDKEALIFQPSGL
jgi:hypothetical protein